jgi:hypothetical protein
LGYGILTGGEWTREKRSERGYRLHTVNVLERPASVPPPDAKEKRKAAYIRYLSASMG